MNGRHIWNDRALAASVEARVRLVSVTTTRLRAEKLGESTASQLEVRVSSKYDFKLMDDILVYGIDYAVVATKEDGQDESQPQFPDSELTIETTMRVAYRVEHGYSPAVRELEAFGEVGVLATTTPYFRELIHSLTSRMGVPLVVDIPHREGTQRFDVASEPFETLEHALSPEIDSEVQKFALFLESISADDFNRSSALFAASQGYSEDTDGFTTFVIENVEIAEAEFIDSLGQVGPSIALANAEEQREFSAEIDETHEQMFVRIRREAKQMKATMVFVSMRLWGAARAVEIDAMDGNAILEAVRSGELTEHYAWYAEHRKPESVPVRLGGLWEITRAEEGNDCLGDLSNGVPAVAPLFNIVLDP